MKGQIIVILSIALFQCSFQEKNIKKEGGFRLDETILLNQLDSIISYSDSNFSRGKNLYISLNETHLNFDRFTSYIDKYIKYYLLSRKDSINDSNSMYYYFPKYSVIKQNKYFSCIMNNFDTTVINGSILFDTNKVYNEIKSYRTKIFSKDSMNIIISHGSIYSGMQVCFLHGRLFKLFYWNSEPQDKEYYNSQAYKIY